MDYLTRTRSSLIINNYYRNVLQSFPVLYMAFIIQPVYIQYVSIRRSPPPTVTVVTPHGRGRDITIIIVIIVIDVK